ncbi:o-succinylbenzoate--CoA ligase [Vibrio sp. 10N.261.55.A7]|uniref:o-succinylbenzoate--CoA ligase n=1 Tax=Vibrio sp. 10N.261.55.A7 TaxID=1880851 RepID=UPI000CAC3F23|nr:o-succinylbenzoate--CoA ligase [Vibrio sp. 10N.261.55.A7]PMJ90872.1 o-succinylbenzoate--CoA ligase [Vibrio sp. 10N.261.55.A7]
MLTIQSSIKQWAQQSPFSCALITPEKNYSWTELQRQVYQYTCSLTAQGVRQGDVVTLVGKNHQEMLFVYLACCALGAVPALTMPQPRTTLVKKLIVLSQEQQPTYLWLTNDVWCRYSEQEREAIEHQCQLLSFEHSFEEPQLESDKESGFDDKDIAPNDLASIIFTSGSMGDPKAVAHTFEQHFSSAAGLLSVFEYGADDTWLLSLPLYHVSGLAIVYRWLSGGGCMKVGTGELSADIQGVTHASLVVAQLRRLIESNQPLTLVRVLLGGSHIPPEIGMQCASLGIDTWLGYGMTEAASTVTAKPVNVHPSAGKVLPNRRLMIKNNRIYIGGKTLAKGYFYQGKITPLIDENGWFDSKDLGNWTQDELEVIGRADNQFISGGENVHCEEIEAQLNQHPQVLQSIVIPVENAHFGHRPVAIVDATKLIKGDSGYKELSEQIKQELDDFLKSRLEKFKWPIRYYQMPSDLNTSGIKVSRKALKQWLQNKASTE